MGPIARVADTSWLYALFDTDDAHHDAAQADVRLPLVTLVPTAILNETLDLVRYLGGGEAARRAFVTLQTLPHFDLWFPVDEQGVVAAWQAHPELSLHDAHAVACSRATGFPLVSFDRRQVEAVGAAAH